MDTRNEAFPDPRRMSVDQWFAFRRDVHLRARSERDRVVGAAATSLLGWFRAITNRGRIAVTKGYWIVRVSVRDAARYPEYLSAAKPAFEKFGARFLVRGGSFEATEGEARDRNVVVEFADYPTALACYRSPEYAAAKAIRHAIADADFIVVEGAG
jgi:uncharacterized protein (DUF1330 family)